MRKRLEESFRLPDDADADQITVFFKHRTLEIHAARRQLVPRQLPIKHPTYLVNPAAEPC